MLQSELDKQVQEYIMELRKAHGTVNTAIMVAAEEGIVQGYYDGSLLLKNGGTIELTKHWAKSSMQWMGLSKCKATTKSSLSA